MGEQGLAVKVIEQANDDLLTSRTLYDLENNYKFFKSDTFFFWCDIGCIGDTTRIIIKKNVDKKYKTLKQVINLINRMNGKFKIEKGNIVMHGCIKRALLLFEKEGDILMYMNAIDSKTLEIRF